MKEPPSNAALLETANFATKRVNLLVAHPGAIEMTSTRQQFPTANRPLEHRFSRSKEKANLGKSRTSAFLTGPSASSFEEHGSAAPCRPERMQSSFPIPATGAILGHAFTFRRNSGSALCKIIVRAKAVICELNSCVRRRKHRRQECKNRVRRGPFGAATSGRRLFNPFLTRSRARRHAALR